MSGPITPPPSSPSETEDRRRLSACLLRRYNRAKELLMQSFGRSDKTVDEEYDAFYARFKDHKIKALKYEKEVRNYYNSLLAMKMHSQRVMESIWDLWDPSWEKGSQIQAMSDLLEHTWSQYVTSFERDVVAPLSSYVVAISEITTKVAKRNKRLLDYDCARHKLEGYEGAKVQDKEKITKAHELAEESLKNYKEFNSMLIHELPKFCDDKIHFIGQSLHNYFGCNSVFYTDVTKIFAELSECIKAFGTAHHVAIRESFSSATSFTSSLPTVRSSDKEHFKASDQSSVMSSESSTHSSSTTGVMYKGKAIASYTGTDDDELTFKEGDIINVMEPSDNATKNHGLLVGMLEKSGNVGLFPSNCVERL